MVMVVALDAAQIVKHVQDFLKIVQAVTLDNFLWLNLLILECLPTVNLILTAWLLIVQYVQISQIKFVISVCMDTIISKASV